MLSKLELQTPAVLGQPRVCSLGKLRHRSLLSKAKRGCHVSAGELITEHYATMTRLAFRYCGTWEDAQDITQEATIKAYKALGSFREESKFSTWLYRITVNVACDWIKRRKRIRRLRDQYLEYSKLDNSGTPFDSLALEDAIGKLSPSERDSIRLTYFEGRTHREAGDILNCAESTVSWKLHQARGKLKQLLKN